MTVIRNGCTSCLVGWTEGHTCKTPATHRIWRPDHGETEDAGDDVVGTDVEDAAEVASDWFHSNSDGWEWSYPITYHVKDLATGIVYATEVDRDYDPTFSASKPKVVAP